MSLTQWNPISDRGVTGGGVSDELQRPLLLPSADQDSYADSRSESAGASGVSGQQHRGPRSAPSAVPPREVRIACRCLCVWLYVYVNC